MSERKEPTSEMYQTALAYVTLLNVVTGTIIATALCILVATS